LTEGGDVIRDGCFRHVEIIGEMVDFVN
jgi:hypothetical protein